MSTDNRSDDPQTWTRNIRFAGLFAALEMPFDQHEVKILSVKGRQMQYITARTAMNRLDNVLGPADWWDEYEARENSVVCRLTLRLPDGTTVTKCDAGAYAGMADQGDDDKSGYSDAFKRAAVKFGVARYLYRDGVPCFEDGEVPEAYAEPPQRPQQAPRRTHEEPRGQRPDDRPQQSQGHQGGNGGGNGKTYGAPRTGKALFAYCKEVEQNQQIGMLKYLNDWSKLNEFPARMVEWDEEQVKLGYAEAQRKLASLGKADGELPANEPVPSPARQFPDNQSGHGRGQYASPDQIEAYRKAIIAICEIANSEWADSWAGKNGELPPGITDLVHPHQITWHLLKWGISTGRLADVGMTVDSETNQLVPKCSIEQAKGYVAVLHNRVSQALTEEIESYVARQKDAALARMKAREEAVTRHGDPDD